MFLTALIALAQPAAASDQMNVPPNRWIVDYSQVACTLARRVGGETSPIVGMHAALGIEPGQLFVMDGGAGLDPRLDGRLELRIDQGAPLAVRARREERSGRVLVRLVPVPEAFLDRVAQSRQMVVAKDDQIVLALALGNAREAVDGLTRCNDDLLESWGIDLAARRALSRLPRAVNSDWAFQFYTSRTAYLALAADVSERGRPLSCRIVASSGNPRMDEAVCRTFRGQARFEPALDSQGRPVRAQFVTSVRWLSLGD